MGEDLMRDLRTALPSLRPSEARVAAYVLDEPNAAIDLTITEIASRSDTSVASVARFCRSLGLSGYSEFRRALSASLGREEVAMGRFGVFDGDITPDDSAKSVVAKVAFLETTTIEETAAGLDLVALDAIADAVVHASRIDIYGVAASGLAAMDLQQKLHRIGLVSFAWSDTHLALTSAATLTDECIAIGFSHTGLTVDTKEALDTARAHGAVTVAVTSFPASPIARDVDHVLTTKASESRYNPASMSARIAQAAIIDFLFVRVTQKLGIPEALLRSTSGAVQSHQLPYERISGAS